MLDVTNAGNRSTLNSAINSLIAKGGTNTQAGIKAGAEVLAGSTADQKNMVLLSDGIPTQSYKINNVSSKLETFTETVETEDGSKTGGSRTKSTMTASDYDYSETVGYGSAPYTRIGTTGTNYYSHSNSAIAQAAMFKNLGSDRTLWTIALETDSDGDATLASIASPGKDNTASTADLDNIFDKIAGSINAAAKNIVVTDPMGPGFVPTNIVVTQGTTSGTITWTVGDLSTPISPGSKIRYAQMTYRVTITDAILAETAVASKYPTNGNAKVVFKNSGGSTQTEYFPVPKVNPIFLKVKKTLLDASGNPVTAATPLFSIKIKNNSSSAYNETFSLSPNQQKVSTKLRLGDTYTISETTTDYDVTFKVNDVVTNTFTVESPSGNPLVDSGQADIEVEVINKAKTRDIKVTKVWLGGPSPRPSVTINLLADGVEVKEFEMVNGVTTHTFTNLPIKKTDGTPIVYTISEDPVAGYITSYNQTTLTVTNDFDEGKKDIPVSKIWLDGPDPKPSVTINLLADGVKVDSQTLPSGTLTYTFTNKPIYKSNGDLIIYTISEDTVAGYTPTYNQSTLTVTNKYDVGKKDIPVTKVWLDGPSPKPSVTINLLADGVEVKEFVMVNGVTTHTFTDLPIKKTDGTPIVYTISEDPVAGYITSYNQTTLTVTNDFDEGKKDIPVSKIWLDGPDPKPSVTINLLADGIEVDQVTLLSGTLTHTFTNKPIYNSNGTLIVYTISEDTVAGYSPTYNQTTLTVSNKFDVGKKDIPVSKVWLDGPSPKPAVTINLLADGTKVDHFEMIAGVTAHTFVGLPVKNTDGSTIVYTVSEEPVEGYITSYNQQTLTVTNDYDEGSKDIPVNKIWVGGPSPRPSITINLLADGVEVDEFVMVNGITAHTFIGLPVRKSTGETIVYTISEDPVSGYFTSYNQEKLTVTNNFDVGKKDIPVSKVWLDGPNPKPAVTINLLADGVKVDQFTLPSGTLTHTFTDKPVYKSNGDPIVYTISEEPVAGYITTYNQQSLTVTNDYDEGSKDIPVTKVWDGGPSPRLPVTINLLADGVEVDQFVMIDGVTTHTFMGLPVRKSNGDTIVYTISEDPIVGYSPSYNQQTLTVTNKFDVGKKNIPVNKVWIGGPSPRPDVTINLLADGVEAAQFVMVDGVITHTFMDVPVSNLDGTTIVYTITEDPVPGYNSSIEGFTATNDFDEGSRDIPVTKIWEGGPLVKPAVTINLLADGLEVAEVVLLDGDTTHLFTGLPMYNSDGSMIVYTLTEEPVDGYITSIVGFMVTNNFDEGSRDIPVNKNWEGGPSPRPSVTINLLADGNKVADFVMVNGVISHTFTGLPVYNSDGTTIVYSITENTVEGYITTINGFTVTNNFDEGSRDIPVTKIWEGGPLVKPAVTINLLADGLKVAEVVLLDGDTTHTFTGLPMFNSDGSMIVYTLTEEPVDGYITSIVGFMVTNNFDEGSRDIPVDKIWKGGPLVKPAITINLLADGVEVAEVVLLDGDTTHTFMGLPIYNSDGTTIVYSVTEETVDGYITSINGFTVTNNFDEGSRDIPVNKIWVGGPSPRPDVTINLLADGTEVAQFVMVNGVINHTFTGFPVYNSDGTTIVYSITEDSVEGYITTINGFTVTNDFDEGSKDIPVTKIWVGGPEVKPTITINLLADGVEVAEVVLLDGSTTHTFMGLPVYNSDGTTIIYTITENPVEGYISSIDGFEVTNDFDEGLKDISIEKIWVGGPETKPAITINLLADGMEIRQVTLIDMVNYTFTGLPIMKSDGTVINYTITEDPVAGYISSINGFEVTNDFDEGLKDIPVNKIWVGGPLVKPSITINLMADGTDVDSVVLENGTTEYIFKDLPVYNSDGTTIVYAISENYVPGYISSIEGFTATNDFDESSRDITVTKVWEGGIGARPTITINLLADGVEVAQVELPAGDTEHTFTGLPVFKSDGTAIVYTITEDPTENYETTIEEFTVFNTWNGELPYTGTNTSTTLPIAGLLLAFTGVALVMRKRHNT